MELSVRASLLLSDGKEEPFLHFELFGSIEDNSGVNLPLKEGRGAEDIQGATRLHP